MNTSRCRFPVLLLALLALLASTVLAMAVPQQIDYQGKLTDSAGANINGATSMVFRIWSGLTGGGVAWAETQALVMVESGLFHVNLGSVNPFPAGLFNIDGLHLSIQVGTDAQMIPRLPIQSVPYAQLADYSLGPWTTSGGDVYRLTGNVGIGHNAPSEVLHVYRAFGTVKAKIQAANGDADVVIDNSSGNPTVEFQRNGIYGGGVGLDPVNDYMFLYHNGSLVFKNNRLGINTNNPSTSLEVNGTVKVTGQCQGTFPRPNYDSGWRYVGGYCDSQNSIPGILTLDHNLGGSVDNYVVELVSKDTENPVAVGINNHGVGSFHSSSGERRGYYFKQLTTTSITLYVEDCDTSSDTLRVRIWVYN